MDESLPRIELGLKKRLERSGRTGKPTTVAGYRDRRQSSCRRLKKNRMSSSHGSTALSEDALTGLHKATQSTCPSSHPSSLSSFRTARSSTGLRHPAVRSLGGDSATTKGCCSNSRSNSKTTTTTPTSSTSRFRSRRRGFRLRAIVNCMVSDMDCCEQQSSVEVHNGDLEKGDDNTCCKSSCGSWKKQQAASSVCVRSDSTVSSPIKAFFIDTPLKHCQGKSPVSTAIKRLFKVRLFKQKSAPAFVRDEESPATSQPPSPNPVRRFRRQETLVKMMEKELAQHSKSTRADLPTQSTTTEIVKHNTAPERRPMKHSRYKSRKAKNRSSSKRSFHKRHATC
eukprot:g1298.t1